MADRGRDERKKAGGGLAQSVARKVPHRGHRKGDGQDKSERETTRDGPERRCIVHRVVRPADEMIRFALAPDGSVVPDLKQTLPGRGVWVTALRKDVDFAGEKELFSRSFKKTAKSGGDLGARVDGLLEAQALNALSLANKAGLVTVGFEKVSGLVQSGKAFALLFATDGAADSRRKMRQKLMATGGHETLSSYQVFGSQKMSLALGRANVVHAALTKGGASTRCVEMMRRLERYRNDPAVEAIDEEVPSGTVCHDQMAGKE